ncbi:uncharacterized protein LOC144123617 [Amblyomma americanum]
MAFTKCFLLVVLVPASMSEICSRHDSLIDRGLEKVLRSDRFSEITLPSFLYNEENLLRVTVDFSGGKLHGFRNIRKNGQSVLNVSDSGSRLTFHIEGGPFEAHYDAAVRTALQRTTLDLRISVPLIQLSFTAQEPSPNELHLELHDMRMARFRLQFDDKGDVRLSSVFYNMVFDELRPSIEVNIGQMLAQELRNLAVEALRAVKAYAAISASHGTRGGGSMASGDWREAPGSSHSYLAPTNGSQSGGSSTGGAYGRGGTLHRLPARRLLPFRAGMQRQRDIFEGCLKTLVLSAGFDPAPLPGDLEAFSFPTGSVAVVEGNMTGLSSIRRKGDTLVALDSCGMRARLNLVFKGLAITATASSSGFLWGFDIKVPEVEALLEIKENNAQLEIFAYKLNFTAPVTVTAKLPSAVATVVNLFGGLPEITLGAEELKQLEESSWKYVQRIVYAIQESVTDPPLLPKL